MTAIELVLVRGGDSFIALTGWGLVAILVTFVLGIIWFSW